MRRNTVLSHEYQNFCCPYSVLSSRVEIFKLHPSYHRFACFWTWGRGDEFSVFILVFVIVGWPMNLLDAQTHTLDKRSHFKLSFFRSFLSFTSLLRGGSFTFCHGARTASTRIIRRN